MKRLCGSFVGRNECGRLAHNSSKLYARVRQSNQLLNACVADPSGIGGSDGQSRERSILPTNDGKSNAEGIGYC
jgi:hypothetical protein